MLAWDLCGKCRISSGGTKHLKWFQWRSRIAPTASKADSGLCGSWFLPIASCHHIPSQYKLWYFYSFSLAATERYPWSAQCLDAGNLNQVYEEWLPFLFHLSIPMEFFSPRIFYHPFCLLLHIRFQMRLRLYNFLHSDQIIYNPFRILLVRGLLSFLPFLIGLCLLYYYFLSWIIKI